MYFKVQGGRFSKSTMVKQYYPGSHVYNVLQDPDIEHPHPLYIYYKSKNHPFSRYYDVENSDHYIGMLKARSSKVKKCKSSKRPSSKKAVKPLELFIKSNQGKLSMVTIRVFFLLFPIPSNTISNRLRILMSNIIQRIRNAHFSNNSKDS